MEARHSSHKKHGKGRSWTMRLTGVCRIAHALVYIYWHRCMLLLVCAAFAFHFVHCRVLLFVQRGLKGRQSNGQRKKQVRSTIPAKWHMLCAPTPSRNPIKPKSLTLSHVIHMHMLSILPWLSSIPQKIIPISLS